MKRSFIGTEWSMFITYHYVFVSRIHRNSDKCAIIIIELQLCLSVIWRIEVIKNILYIYNNLSPTVGNWSDHLCLTDWVWVIIEEYKLQVSYCNLLLFRISENYIWVRILSDVIIENLENSPSKWSMLPQTQEWPFKKP